MLTGRLTIAFTSPVDACRATRAAGWVTPSRACSAARCTARSRVVTRGWGSAPAKRCRTVTTFPVPSTTWTSPEGAPRSWCSAAASRPLRPTRSPAWYRSPRRGSSSAVISPMEPTPWAPRSAVAAALIPWRRNTIPGTGAREGPRRDGALTSQAQPRVQRGVDRLRAPLHEPVASLPAQGELALVVPLTQTGQVELCREGGLGLVAVALHPRGRVSAGADLQGGGDVGLDAVELGRRTVDQGPHGRQVPPGPRRQIGVSRRPGRR